MKIFERSSNETTFEMLKVGDTFKDFNGNHFLKTYLFDVNNVENYGINAVNIHTGEMSYFFKQAPVIQTEAQVAIRI